MGYSPRGQKELDTTERLHFHFTTCQAELGNQDHVINKILSLFLGISSQTHQIQKNMNIYNTHYDNLCHS